MKQRLILHVDMDAFFTSVEQNDNPHLRGRPVMVGGARRRGVVAAASYEAREYGVRSAMPAVVARRLCPDGVFLSSRFDRYREVSALIFEVFATHTALVEGVSLDEAYLDMTHLGLTSRGDIEKWGRHLKKQVMAQVGLTASIGIAHNKLVAKIASDYDKPDGLVYISPPDIHRMMDPLPIRRLPGVGPMMAAKLRSSGLLTIGQIRCSSAQFLADAIGDHATELLEKANGRDERRVTADRNRRSVSQETTFEINHTSIDSLRPVVWAQAKKVAERLATNQLLAKSVHIKLRSKGFSTTTRSQSLIKATDAPEMIAKTAYELLRDWAQWRSAFSIRLFGLGVSIAD